MSGLPQEFRPSPAIPARQYRDKRAGSLAEAGPLKTAPRTADWHNGNPFSVKIPTTALSERFERALVADPFNEHDRTRVDACGQRVRGANKWSTRTGSCPFHVRRAKSLLLVHFSDLHSSHAAWRVADSSTIGNAQTASDTKASPDRDGEI